MDVTGKVVLITGAARGIGAEVARQLAARGARLALVGLEIALLLAQDAELILLDEPTAGMTVQETQKTADICNRLKGKHTIIVVEHDMGFVRRSATSSR